MDSWNIGVLIVCGIGIIYSLAPYIRALFSDKITLVNRKTGKQVTISKKYDTATAKQLRKVLKGL